jgi:hypothetical protein
MMEDGLSEYTTVKIKYNTYYFKVALFVDEMGMKWE